LCGVDPLNGNDYEHRKDWIEQRLALLAAQYAIDVIGFSIMSNHFHVLLRNRPDIVSMWSDQDVAFRWLMLCPPHKLADGTPEKPNQSQINAIVNDPARLLEVRRRLSDISWFMKMMAEPIARRANAEEGVTGRFWQGRFKGVKLCDAAAILACLIYVDLNPIRAGLADSPEESKFTSAKRRIDQTRGSAPRATDWLIPLPLDESDAPGPVPADLPSRCSDKGVLPVTLTEYLMLLDWTGRQVVDNKSGRIPESLAPILVRLGIDTDHWLDLATRFGQLFFRIAGSRQTVADEAHKNGRRWYQAPGRDLFTATAA
jgi:REP element-mobilizing transposase RayT